MNFISRLIIILLFLFLNSCSSDSLWESGRYHIYYIDGIDKRYLGYALDGGGSYIRIVGKLVVAVGSNDKYIIIKQLYSRSPEIIRYYIVYREKDNTVASPHELVSKALTLKEFKNKKSLLGLPDFTKEFRRGYQ